MQIIRKKLTQQEFSPSNLRYNAGTDEVEFSPDNGLTWVEEPSLDPRYSSNYRLPPLSGGDERCRAAYGMMDLIRQTVNARIDAAGQAEMIGAIMGIVAFLPGFNILAALLVALVTFAFTIGREILETAFSEEVYNNIACVFFCNIDADGQMSEEQFNAAYEQFNSFALVERQWCQYAMNLFGYVGFSNAGVQFEGGWSCECACQWCYEWDFTLNDGGFVSPDSSAVYTPGVGWVGTYIDNGSRAALFITKALADLQITSIEMTYTKTAGSNVNNVNRLRLRLDGGFVMIDDSNVIGTDIVKGTSGDEIADEIYIDVNSGASTATVNVSRVAVTGFGDKPTGGQDC